MRRCSSCGRDTLAAAVVQRMARTGDARDRQLCEGLFKQIFCMTDMLPMLASKGMLVEIGGVRDILLEGRPKG